MVGEKWFNRYHVHKALIPCLAEENQRLLLECPDVGRLLPSLLATRALSVRQQSLALLLQLAQTDHGRSLVISHLDLTR